MVEWLQKLLRARYRVGRIGTRSMIGEYEIYADERYHSRRYLMVGGIMCTDRRREHLHERLMQVRSDFSLVREMRWTKVSRRFLDAYEAWADVFLEDPFARFSLLVIDTMDPTWRQLSPRFNRRLSQDDRLASAFYQFLLVSFGKLTAMKRWWAYPDQGFFSRDTVLRRVEFLFNRTYKIAFGAKTSRIIRLMQARDSKAEDLIQLADLILGAFSYNVGGDVPASKARRELLEHCVKAIGRMPKTHKGLDKVIVTRWVHPQQFSYR